MSENNWIEVFIETAKEGFEPVSGIIYQCGITGVVIEDSDDFAEFLENPARDWDYVEDKLVEAKSKLQNGITFYVRDNANGIETLNMVKSMLKAASENEKDIDFGSLKMTLKNIKEDDWANNWKKYFKPMAVGKKMTICPSWESCDNGGIILKIDPGHVFGTGTHETTQLCIEQLENFAENSNVLDIGCGSGILSIAALLLGAGHADAIDIDPNAVDIAYENAEMNGIGKDVYSVISGDILTDAELDIRYGGKKYDVVLANIVADVVIALTDKVPGYIKDGGVFIASGMIVERLEEVIGAMKGHGFEILDKKIKKGWAVVAARYGR